jgi:anthranilate phosphoribosyltransferase
MSDIQIKSYISRVVDGKDLSRADARAAMGEIMGGRATPAQIAAFITALRMKGETIDEITGCAEAMRAQAAGIRPRRTRKSNVDKDDISFLPGVVVDTCGTGGDGMNTFNISTASAFVAAGAGVTVAKHGNRAVSSGCGSADVMRMLGVNIDLSPGEVQMCIERIGIGFLFAPTFHAAMKHAIGPRREVGIRTIFNVLGPLTNPAGATAQVLGVYAPHLTKPLAAVLGKLGCQGALVVHGQGGYDEITITGSTQVTQLKNGRTRTYTLRPEDFGMKSVSAKGIRGRDAEYNADFIKAVLNGDKGPGRDVVLLNSAAALLAAGAAKDMTQGVQDAALSIDSGAAARKLDLLVKETNT